MTRQLNSGDLIIGTDLRDVLAGDLTGNSGDLGPDDRILGGGGNDTLYGDSEGYPWPGTGDDTLDGQRGDDVIACGRGDDIASGGSGNDALFGELGNDILYGSAGDDTISGGAGADTLIGGVARDVASGSDTVGYRASSAGVTVDLAAGTSAGGDAEGDRLFGFRNVEGSGFGDVLVGNDGDNRLVGERGGDRLIGGAGDDTLDGGFGGSWTGGEDTLTGARAPTPSSWATGTTR
ncbi:calcium-binding protein [Roseomonas sp. CCTCC AB2023176]|uniref:calcium-binding protein n=1 Tax=Roseomonas sp. CCTCC AB2023176 TaxID=3342640 RepID=UPI0035DCCFDE